MNLIELLLKPVIRLCEKTGRVFNITGTGADTDVYLIKYYVFQNKYFNVFIHIFLRSDRDDMHDHPWNFGTYVIRKGYKEEVINPEDPRVFIPTILVNVRDVCQNRWATRKAETLHRVKLYHEFTMAEKDIAPMTVCITGPTKRDWGFVKDGKWIFWKKYLGLPDDEPTRG
jgi:hypothetical protein